MTAPQTLLVTGGAGFIGANFVRYLLDAAPSVRIVNLDALTYAGNLANLAGCLDDPRHVFVRGNITNSELVGYLLQTFEVDGIINFAAESHVDRSILGPVTFVETNVKGTLTLLTAAREARVRRFLQISTDEVYGSLGPTGSFREDSPIRPNSPYSASKAAADHLVRAFVHTHGMDALITRSSNNYGPWQFPEKMIPLMIHNARCDRPLPLYGDGRNVRDWIHVLDHCRAVWQVYRKGRSGEVYNVGAGNERTNLEVVRTILRRLGKPESLIQFVADRPGHDRRYAIDATKLRSELGWRPRVDFESGIAQTVAWYLDHPDWLDKIVSGEYRKYYRTLYEGR
ncbi:MAG: dTDP-glucose 4,6-dehydratase [Kiritimatiellaeota bacterium]|nr:dTDP-glucose 4,6-dehydratase [Kiritimatiellota bacterium]